MRPIFIPTVRKPTSAPSVAQRISGPAVFMCLLLVACAVPANGDPASGSGATTGSRLSKATVEKAYSGRELGDRLIALVGNIRHKSDISVKSVEKIMARKMARHPSREAVFFLTERTKENGVYRISVEGGQSVERKILITTSTYRVGASGCVLDFPRFHRAVGRLGYEASRMVAPHGLSNRWKFVKDDIYIKAYYRSSSYYARGEDLKDKHLCIETIIIN